MQASSGTTNPLLQRQRILDLVLVFVVALGARVLFATLNPPWLTPDETSHFTYVSYLVETGRIPNMSAPDEGLPTESNELRESCRVTLCWAISGLGGPGRSMDQLPIEHDYERARALRLAPDQRRSNSGSSASSYPPLYYLMVAVLYRALYEAPILMRLLAARLLSCALSALVAVFGYLMTRELTDSARWGRSVGLSLALMPMHAFIGSGVNNDAAMFATTSALCWFMAMAWRRGEMVTPRFGLLCGVVSGAALLAKPTSAPVVLGMSASIALACSASGPKFWRVGRQGIMTMASYVVSMAVLEGCWIAYRRAFLSAVTIKAPPTVGPLGILAGEAPFSFRDYLVYLYRGGTALLEWMFVRSFWGVYGWLEIHLSDATYWGIEVVVALASLGLIWVVCRERAERWLVVRLSVLVVGNVCLLLVAADFFLSFANKGTSYGIQGRYFFGTLPAFIYLLTRGISALMAGWSRALLAPPVFMLWLYAQSIATLLQSYYGLRL